MLTINLPLLTLQLPNLLLNNLESFRLSFSNISHFDNKLLFVILLTIAARSSLNDNWCNEYY